MSELESWRASSASSSVSIEDRACAEGSVHLIE